MQALRDLLRSELARSLRALPEPDRLRAAWPLACGMAMAEHGTPGLYSENRLEVLVDTEAWLDEFRHRSAILRAELARIAAVDLREIHFSLKKQPL